MKVPVVIMAKSGHEIVPVVHEVEVKETDALNVAEAMQVTTRGNDHQLKKYYFHDGRYWTKHTKYGFDHEVRELNKYNLIKLLLDRAENNMEEISPEKAKIEMDEIASRFLLIDGIAFEQTGEPRYVIGKNEYQVNISFSDKLNIELSYCRADEFDKAVERAQKWAGGKLRVFESATISVARNHTLTLPSGPEYIHLNMQGSAQAQVWEFVNAPKELKEFFPNVSDGKLVVLLRDDSRHLESTFMLDSGWAYYTANVAVGNERMRLIVAE